MSAILIRFQKPGCCVVEHEQSGTVIATDIPPEYGGNGRSFSATDLVAAALGTCIATNLDSIALRHNIPLETFSLKVDKTLANDPKRITGLTVTVTINTPLQAEVLLKLKRASENCAVKRSLAPAPDMQITIEFVGALLARCASHPRINFRSSNLGAISERANE